MIKISNFTVEYLNKGCVTDEANPKFSWAVYSDENNIKIKSARLLVNGWETDAMSQIGIKYQGPALHPFTEYKATIFVETEDGKNADETITFETGFMNESFKGSWITDATYTFTEKGVSPVPMTFKKEFKLKGRVKSAKLYATAIGMYSFLLNGKKVGEDYFTPGFTSYKKNMQYQKYDIADLLNSDNTLIASVAGGWAVGSFVFTRKNRITADKQALLAEIHIEYEDGTEETIITDDSWDTSMEGPFKEADIYDGEVFDANVSFDAISYKKAKIENVKIAPQLQAAYGVPVRTHECFTPVSLTKIGNELIYDFGQNFAGLVSLFINGKKGQEITVRHAEVLHEDGTLNTDFLRTAKARITYICRDGQQQYMPTFTYMGFRYISVSGIDENNVEVKAYALYSDVESIGEFECSNPLINRLQKNIKWGAKSNFVEIPTDCPQRDERMGWTGDIALFASTACYNFELSRFLRKWLKDMRAEQLATGGIPNTVPSQGYGFPATMPTMAIDFWGDASVLVPWALYMNTGDISVLSENYEMMKKYVNACKFWAGLFSVGKHRYIWHTPSTLHFGDWVAPDVPKMSQWQKRSKWTATASLANTSFILSEIASLLDKDEDAKYYYDIFEKTSKAYEKVFTDGNGKLKEEFQTGYVLPIHFGMLTGDSKRNAAANLSALVKKGDYQIGTGFPGTPYILFALADNGHEETAFNMLNNTKCPSWLYEVKVGATTIWERWDGLDENGNCPIGDDGTDNMISYNHYASGAVGDFLYKRVAGIEPTSAGYKTFRIKPLVGGDLTSVKASTMSPYGKISSQWKIEGDKFEISVEVPVNTKCELVLPNGEIHHLCNGRYDFVTIG